MADDHRRRLRHLSKTGEPEPADRCSPWSTERLLRMDQKFRERMERAFDRGSESRAAAAGIPLATARQPR
jgi:hypothetical protein